MNALDGNIVKAEKIIQIFKTKEIKQGLKSDLYHSCRCNLFPSAKDFYSALDTLAEYGHIAYENVTAANNRTAQMVYVNPHIWFPLDFVVFMAVDIETAVLRLLHGTE